MARATISTWQPEQLRALLHERGWTIGQLAKVLDCPRSRVDGWLYNGTPSPAALLELAHVLEVDTTRLAPLSDEPTLHELRWHAGLTAGELATAVGLSLNTVGAQLRGENPISRPEKWCAALHVGPDELDAAWRNSRNRGRPD